MQTRLVLLLTLSLALLLPTASWAGFLGRPPQNLTVDQFDESTPAGLPGRGLANRANQRAAFHVLGFPPPPPIEGNGPGPEPDPQDPGSAVPEPSAALLIAFGLAGIALRRRAA